MIKTFFPVFIVGFLLAAHYCQQQSSSQMLLPTAALGSPYGVDFSGDYVIRILGGLPDNFRFYSKNILYGVPVRPGNYVIYTEITSPAKNKAFNFSYLLHIRGIQVKGDVPSGIAGAPYEYEIQTTNGVGNLTFMQFKLPSWLRVDGKKVFGTPTVPGRYNVQFTVQDLLKNIASLNLQILIKPALIDGISIQKFDLYKTTSEILSSQSNSNRTQQIDVFISHMKAIKLDNCKLASNETVGVGTNTEILAINKNQLSLKNGAVLQIQVCTGVVFSNGIKTRKLQVGNRIKWIGKPVRSPFSNVIRRYMAVIVNKIAD